MIIMKKTPLAMIFTGVIITAIIAVSIVSFYPAPTPSSVNQSNSIPATNFVYFDIDKIHEILLTEQILISTPNPITDHTVDQYCSFFDRDNIKRSVPYCLTTAILNPDGTPLGNMNMGGNPITPAVALSVIEVPSLDAHQEEVAFVFQTMVDTLVCDCWSAQKPGGYESVAAWIDAAKQEHAKFPEKTLKSKIDNLAQKQLVLEITAIEESYVLTFVILV